MSGFPDAPKVFGYTHGCRLNACETDAMVESVAKSLRGSVAGTASNSDIIIVNTCTVTGKSGARCRKAVRAFRERNPNAFLVVTGCASEIHPEQYSRIENGLVIGNRQKAHLPEILQGIPVPLDPPDAPLFPGFTPSVFRRTRAFLKIQDGCDHRCTYCIVPLARGPSRSQPRETVLAQARELQEKDRKELCLVGVDLADYGRDLYPDYRLPDLVGDLLQNTDVRIRLSSLEPQLLSGSLLSRLRLPGVCRHFHIPLQSGSSRILASMGRGYDGRDAEALLERIHRFFPGVCIGADLIAGFPGETEADLSETLQMVRSGLLAYLHVFPFSPRPGTPASTLKRLHTETVRERADLLRGESATLRRSFRESQLGRRGRILVEGRRHGGAPVGLTDNYIPVRAPEGAREGEWADVVLEQSNICWEVR